MPDPTKGFVKIDRGILHHPMMRDPHLLQLWLWLLASTAWKDEQVLVKVGRGSRLIQIQRGQVLVIRSATTQLLGCTDGGLQSRLEKLQSMGQISRATNQQCCVVTICNWEAYQGTEARRSRATSRATAGQQPGNSRATGSDVLLEESKEEGKEPPNPQRTKFLLPEPLASKPLIAAWEAWEKHRSEIHKPLTERAACEQIAKMTAWGAERAERAIRHSIASGWQGLFEPKASDGAPVTPTKGQLGAEFWDMSTLKEKRA